MPGTSDWPAWESGCVTPNRGKSPSSKGEFCLLFLKLLIRLLSAG